ncbi:MAG: bifunctional oligoribonuclease/PAP phosphatase NrnA [Candidatus Zixiibacteriota bacterium]
MNKAAATRIIRQLQNADRILITSHRDPDGDSVGSQLAFHEFWTRQRRRRADVLNDGPLPARYRCLDPRRIIRAPSSRARRNWDAAIVFECSSLDRVGSVEPLLPPGLPIINIDHHQGSDRFGTINVVDPSRSSCTELVYELLKHWRARITPRMAQLLAAGILTDTGRFHHPSTNVATFENTAALLRLGADITQLTDRIYFELPLPHFQLVHHVLGQAELRAGGRICLLTLRIRDRRRYGVSLQETEGLVDHSLSLKGVMVGALLKELGPRRTKVSLRSPGSVNVAALARRFGGGGHKNAAGCMIELPVRATADALEDAIRSVLSNRRAVGNRKA